MLPPLRMATTGRADVRGGTVALKHSRHAGRAAWLHQDPGLAGHVANGVSQAVLVDGEDLVDERACVRECQVAGAEGQEAVGDARGALERDGAARRERTAHLGSARGLDANHACVGPQPLDRRRNAGEQPAAADRHVDLVHVGAVLDNLQADRALASDNPGVVERRVP